MVDDERYFAHSRTDCPLEKWQPLAEHLRAVGNLAAEFAAHFEGADWARLAGLWHDLGKYSREFQSHIRADNAEDAHLETLPRKVDHSTAGAIHANECIKPDRFKKLLAYVIAGHHAGLPDGEQAYPSSLRMRLGKTIPRIDDVPQSILDAHQSLQLQIPFQSTGTPDRDGLRIALFCRMIFSCLVDADFLDSERFMRPDQCLVRGFERQTLQSMLQALECHLANVQARAAKTVVNELRADVLQQCRDQAKLVPGLFSLTVPTGGGKTLSSLAFALSHAMKHDKRRVIYVIPFTSIIEQNADVFRSIFDHDTVVEHHSNLAPENETVHSGLASENWDAPLVVTTNEQFYESLFAARTSRCRKLHNIVDSIIIVDEAQALPVTFLKPCLEVLQELVETYNCTVVLCTATQPAIMQRDDFRIGLTGIREIIKDPVDLHTRLKRVEATYRNAISDNDLCKELEKEYRVLCILNTRKHARSMAEKLSGQCDVLHLSALMCPAHRRQRLAEIRRRLSNGEQCRVISTQLVEAGVDLDFPVVFRAMAGGDSLAQAAGRCNREGKLPCLGRVIVFEPEQRIPRGYLHQSAAAMRQFITNCSDPLSLDAIEKYFRLHYWMQEDKWDGRNIMRILERARIMDISFREIADLFRMIESGNGNILIPFEESGMARIDELRRQGPSRSLMRSLQNYSVQIPYVAIMELAQRGVLEEIHEGIWGLQNARYYDALYGLLVEKLDEMELLLVE